MVLPVDDTAAANAPPAPANAQFAPGDLVAERYRVVRFIARGAMGEVYEVEDKALGTRVALKALRAHLVADDDASERFRREILLARQVAHPNVCRIFDLAVHRSGSGRLPVLTMELLGGRTLAERLRTEGKLDPDVALPLVRQIAAGLAEAHRLGIVHRDLKSANVVLEEGTRPRVVVTDFGLARTVAAPDESMAGSVVGTPAYMAPEQLAGGPVGPPTDVYALGVVICEMLTGHLAGDRAAGGGRTAASQLRAEITGAGAAIPPVWRRVVDRCLAFNPAARFGSMDEVVAALRGPRAPTAAPQLAHGDRVGRYRVLRPSAISGLYRARDSTAGRTACVQLLSSELGLGPERLERLAEELRGMVHPALAPVLELDAHDGAPVVVLDAVEGGTLAAAIAAGRFAPPRALAIAAALAGALGVVHDRGVVVGELRPERILLAAGDRPQLVDVGAARLAAAVGLDPPSDASNDLRGVLALLGELITGRRDHDATALPAELRAIVERRWHSAHDLAFHLQRAAETLLARRRRRRAFTAVGVAGLAAAIAATALVATRARPAPPAAAQAVASADAIAYQRITFHHGTVGGARFAGDGRTVIFASARDGEPMHVDTSVPGTFTSHPVIEGYDLGAASPSGDLALFHDVRGRRVLARMSLAAAAPKDVAEHVLACDLGPGGELALVRAEGGRRIVEMPPGRALYSTAALVSAIRVSPAGDGVAIAEHPIEYDDAGRVVMISAAGEVTPLTDVRWGVLRGLAWHDDREVWFFAQEKGYKSGLYAVTTAGALRSLVTLPFGARLLDVRGGDALLTFENVTIRALARGRDQTAARDLSWLDYSLVTDVSQDGASLVMAEGAMGASDDYEVYLRPTDGRPAVSLGTGYSTQFSPDGARVLVFRRDGAHHRLWLVPVGAGDPVELPRGPITTYHQIVAGWFPDGKKVVFMGKAGGDWRLWEQDVTGGDPRPLTPEGVQINRGAIVSPDGDHLVVLASGKRELRSISTGEQRPIAGLEDGMIPARFTADGKALLAWSRRGSTLRIDRVELASGALTPVTSAELDGDLWTGPWITPDGGTLAFSSRRLQHVLFEVSGLR